MSFVNRNSRNSGPWGWLVHERISRVNEVNGSYVECKDIIFVTADLFEDGRIWKSRSKERDVIPGCHRHLQEWAQVIQPQTKRPFRMIHCIFRMVSVFPTYLVGDVIRTGIIRLHHHVRMQEVGLNHVWNKRRVLLLKHDGYNVVAYVSLPLQLDCTDKQK